MATPPSDVVWITIDVDEDVRNVEELLRNYERPERKANPRRLVSEGKDDLDAFRIITDARGA